jgi:hypothetical protein
MNGQAPEGGGPADTAPPTASTIPIGAKPTSGSGMARARDFEAALSYRDVIGHAEGVLMNHFRVDAVRAFDMRKHVL